MMARSKKKPVLAKKPGRPEELTEELARKIVKLIEVLPDMDVRITWPNIVAQVKRKFGRNFERGVLAKKRWNGSALIHDAYKLAGKVEAQLQAQGRSRRYANLSRQRLQARIESLSARLNAAEQTIAELRVMHYDQLDIFRATRLDLRLEVERRQKSPQEDS